MAILSSADFDAIRATLDVSLSATDLPDRVINQPIYLEAAEAELLAEVEGAAEATGDDLKRAKRIVILLVAARLTSAVVRITSMTTQSRDQQFTKATFDPEKRAAELRAMARGEIEQLKVSLEEAVETETPSRPTMFAVASGYRGR